MAVRSRISAIHPVRIFPLTFPGNAFNFWLVIEGDRRLINKLLSIWRPEAFHGAPRNGNYFEGWFYKLVDAGRRRVLAVIPGVFFGKDPAVSHAFVQILDGTNHVSTYHRYPVSEFQASIKSFRIAVGPNRFEKGFMELDIQSPDRSVKGRLDFLSPTGWRTRPWSPGVMGWFAFVPFMECNHGVISMDHEIRGTLSMDGRSVSFEGGRGYIEKDWGRSFPSDYVWMQSNHFGQAGTGLMVSVARIPWLGGAFRGFIIGLAANGRLFRFATYTGALVRRLHVTDRTVEIDVSDRRHRLVIRAFRAYAGLLHAPYSSSMVSRIAESLASRVEVRLSLCQGGADLFRDVGDPAGMEVHGNIETIGHISSIRRPGRKSGG
jgi:tocopherol cyclase